MKLFIELNNSRFISYFSEQGNEFLIEEKQIRNEWEEHVPKLIIIPTHSKTTWSALSFILLRC